MKKFETGKTYYATYITNSDLKCFFKIIKRTEKSVWLQKLHGGTFEPVDTVKRRTIKTYGHYDEETVRPDGNCSMALILGADKLALNQ